MKKVTPAPIVRISDLWFSYDDNPVLKNVSLELSSRDFACIVGPNGGGKSTLVKIIMGQLPPDRGTIQVFGNDPSRVSHRIGYLPQHAALDARFPITVGDVVLTGRLNPSKLFGRYTKDDRAIAERTLTEVDLIQQIRRPFAELSGGQKQRALIARALAAEPELLVLDEPSANLDPKVEQELFDLLHNLNEKLAILMVSHNLTFVSAFVKTVVCVNQTAVVHPTGALPEHLGGGVLSSEMKMILHDQLCTIGEDH